MIDNLHAEALYVSSMVVHRHSKVQTKNLVKFVKDPLNYLHTFVWYLQKY